MRKFFGVWVAVLWCILGSASRAAADDAPERDVAKSHPFGCSEAAPEGDAPGPARCEPYEDGSHPGLDRKDPFAPGDVVLTFDDGPQPWATGKLLDELDKHRFKATFFVVGQWVRPDTYHLIQRMVASGHEIGTHTYSHDLRLTRRGWGVDYVEGQYELVRVLVELALVARSQGDFEEIYRRVLERKPGNPLTPLQVRAQWRAILRNHLALLTERGFDEERRVYPMLFARPPGGIPYEGTWPSDAMRDVHERALKRLGLMNVLWHGGSGDTVLGQLDDFAFLVGNVRYHTKKGGVLLIHDRMRRDAIAASFERIAKDPAIRVTTLKEAVAKKYACNASELYASLRRSTAVARREKPR